MNKFEEYKLFVEDTARFSERRQTVTSTYVAVNSLLLMATAFLVKDAGLKPVWRGYVSIFLLVTGIVFCLQWERMINKYKRLVAFRIDQLREMEKDPAMAGSHQMYHKEDMLYPRDAQGKPIPGQGLNISDRERWLPWTFIIVYALFLLGLGGVLTFAPAWLTP